MSPYLIKISFISSLLTSMLLLPVAYADTNNKDTVQHYFSQSSFSQSSSYQSTAKNSTESIDAVAYSTQKEHYLSQRAQLIQHYLAHKQYDNLTLFIHPTKGVRFSMYAYVDPDTDKVFSQDQFEKYLAQSRIKFTWGGLDGTGDLYIDTLPSYLDNWVKAEHFNSHHSANSISVNQFQGVGNSLNNLTEAYPQAEFVEFYHAGTDPRYGGMDWRSLRLVFERYKGEYYLIGIITDEWTI